MDTNILNLEQDEYVVYEKEDSVVIIKEEEFEFLVTNRNLYLVETISPMFKKTTYNITKLPIENIRVIDDIPQIKIEQGDYSCWNIVILFNNGVKKIGIDYGSLFKKQEVKKEVERLAEQISQLRTMGTIVLKPKNHSNNPPQEERPSSKKKSFIGNKITNTIGILRDTLNPNVEEEVTEKIEEQPSESLIDNEYDFCTHCGSKKKKTSRFCPSCGSEQTVSTLVHVGTEHDEPKFDDYPFLMKHGFVNYDIVKVPHSTYYVDYTSKKFAKRNIFDIKIIKFKEFIKYEIEEDDLKSETKIVSNGNIVQGAFSGGSIAKSLIGKSAIKVGAIAGAAINGIFGAKINFPHKIAVRVTIHYRSYNNETWEFADKAALDKYKPLLEMLDRINDINHHKNR